MGDLIEPLPPTELTQALVQREENEDLSGIRAGSSAKIDQLVELLRLTPSSEKSLVFSQFTSFLDKVHNASEPNFVGNTYGLHIVADCRDPRGRRVSLIFTSQKVGASIDVLP
jgi:hypothetical protein